MSKMIFGPDGRFRTLYSDDVAPVAREVGSTTVRRASHVEPSEDGSWYVDMSPCRGPVLRSFMTRADALEAEARWLIEHDLPVPEG